MLSTPSHRSSRPGQRRRLPCGGHRVRAREPRPPRERARPANPPSSRPTPLRPAHPALADRRRQPAITAVVGQCPRRRRSRRRDSTASRDGRRLGAAATTMAEPGAPPPRPVTWPPASVTTSQAAARSHGLRPPLEVGVEGSGGDVAEVEGGTAEAPDVADLPQHPQQGPGPATATYGPRSRNRCPRAPATALTALSPASRTAAGRRPSSTRRRRHGPGRGRHPRGRPLRRPPAATGRCGRSAHDGGHGHGIRGYAVEVVHGAVDRVDDPGDLRGGGSAALLFAQEAVAGTGSAQSAADEVLARAGPSRSPRPWRCSWSSRPPDQPPLPRR